MVALSPLSPAEARATSAVRGRRKPAVLAFAKPGSSLLISLAASAGFLALWFLVARLRLVTPLFLPSPLEVAQAFVTVARDGFADATLLQHAGASLMRVSIAFLVAFLTAVPLGLAMGLNRWVKGIFDPPIEFYWPIPPLAYLPLVIIWLGIGETAKISIIALAMFAPLVISAQAGVRSVSIGRVQAALSLGRLAPAALLPCRPARRPAGDPDRRAHRHRRRLVDAGGGRAGRRHTGPGIHDPLGLRVPGHRRGLRRDPHHRRFRHRLRARRAQPRTRADALERQGVNFRRWPPHP